MALHLASRSAGSVPVICRNVVYGSMFTGPAIFLPTLAVTRLKLVANVTRNNPKDNGACLSCQKLLLVISQSLLPIRLEIYLLEYQLDNHLHLSTSSGIPDL